MEWFDDAWTRRQSITIPAAKVGADATDYPVTLTIPMDRAMIERLQASAGDLVITGSDGTIKLPHRIEGVEPMLNADGVRSWFTHPTSIRSGNKTHSTWTNSDGEFVVGTLNHTSGAYAEFVLGTSAFTPDDHDNAALHVIQNGVHAGKLLALYSAHVDQSKRSRRSVNVNDSSAWEDEVSFSQNNGSNQVYTYSHVAEFSDGTIRVWFRGFIPSFGTPDERDRYYADSTDGGDTWSTPVSMFIEGSGTDQRPYFQQFWNPDDNPDRVDFLCTNLSPNEGASNLYHFYYDHSTGFYYKSDGTSIGSTLPFEPGDVTELWDGASDGGEPWCWDIKRTSDGRIGALFSVNADDNSGSETPYLEIQCWHGSFDPDAGTWSFAMVADMGPSMVYTKINTSGSGEQPQPSYAGGCTFLHADNDDIGDVLVSVPEAGHRVLKRFTSDDDGATWDEGTLFGAKTANKQFRPAGVRGFGIVPHADLLATWLSGRYTNYIKPDFDCGIGCQHASSRVGRLIVTFKADLSSSTDNEFFAYWGNSGASDQQDASNVFPPSMITYEVGDISDLPQPGFTSGASLNKLTVMARGSIRETFAHNSDNRHILSNWAANMIFRLKASTGTLQFYINDLLSSAKTIDATDLDGSVADTLNHYAGVYNNPVGMRAYLNGVASAVSSPTISQPSKALKGGLWAAKSPHLFGVAVAEQEYKGEIVHQAAYSDDMGTDWIALNAAMWEGGFAAFGEPESLPESPPNQTKNSLLTRPFPHQSRL